MPRSETDNNIGFADCQFPGKVFLHIFCILFKVFVKKQISGFHLEQTVCIL